MNVPADVHLTNPANFDQRYVEHTAEARTYEEAYLLTEKDYRRVFGKNKYSNFDSFRVARSKRIKRNLKN